MKDLFTEIIDLMIDGTIAERDLNFFLANLVLNCETMQKYKVI